MGYATLFANCIRCGKPFTGNPDLVPCIRFKGVKEPVCEPCYHVLAAIQKKHGLPVLQLPPGAYEAADVGEM